MVLRIFILGMAQLLKEYPECQKNARFSCTAINPSLPDRDFAKNNLLI